MILLLANPHARWARRWPHILQQLQSLVRGRGEVLTPHSLDLLRVVLPAWRDRDVTGIAILGGDGSLGRMLGEVVRCWDTRPLPWVAPLGGGTMNTIARSVGASGSAIELLQGALREAEHPGSAPRVTRHVLEVDGERRGFLFGNGLFARYIEAYEEGDPGPSRAASVLARAVGSALIGGRFARRLTEPVVARVYVDGELLRDGAFLTVCAGTIDQVGLGFRPFFGAVETPGSLHALAIGGSPFALATQLHHAYAGRSMRSADVAERVGRSLRIEATTPQLVMMDGDLMSLGHTVTVRVGAPIQMLARPAALGRPVRGG